MSDHPSGRISRAQRSGNELLRNDAVTPGRGLRDLRALLQDKEAREDNEEALSEDLRKVIEKGKRSEKEKERHKGESAEKSERKRSEDLRKVIEKRKRSENESKENAENEKEIAQSNERKRKRLRKVRFSKRVARSLQTMRKEKKKLA